MTPPTPIEPPISALELAQHLRRMMELANQTPASLSVRLGFHQTTINAWLMGRHLEKCATILGAFEALGCVIVIRPPTKRRDTPCVEAKTHR
jgi:hypothetical protein